MSISSKPRVTPVSSGYFRVNYRELEGSVRQDGEHCWGSVYWPAGSSTGETVRQSCYDNKGAYDALLARLDEIADCHALLTRADAFEAKGGRVKLETLGGSAALDAFDAAKKQLMEDNADGIKLVQSMLKIASKKKLPKPATQIIACPWNKDTYGVTIVPGFSVAITDGPTYFIGGRAEYDSYNLHYFGPIQSITANTVTISGAGTGRGNKRLRLLDFATRNKRSLEGRFAANVETSYCI